MPRALADRLLSHALGVQSGPLAPGLGHQCQAPARGALGGAHPRRINVGHHTNCQGVENGTEGHRHHALRGSATGHLRSAQKGPGLRAAPLPGELRPGHLRHPDRACRRHPGGGGRRTLLQPRGDPDHPAHGRRQRGRAGAGGTRRHPLHPGGLLHHPQAQDPGRHRALRQPQPRGPGGRLRHQVQRRGRRPGLGVRHRRDLRPHPNHRRLPHPGLPGHGSGPAGPGADRDHGGGGRRPGGGLRGPDGGPVRLRRHSEHVQLRTLPHALRRHARGHRTLCHGDPGEPPGRAARDRDERRAAGGLRRRTPGPQPGPCP